MVYKFQPSQRASMRTQRRLKIYVSFDSAFVIRYLDLVSSDLFIVHFVDCYFNETNFPLSRERKILYKLGMIIYGK